MGRLSIGEISIIGMLHLGGMYQLGLGVARNDEAAVHWYRKASDAGDASAMFDLAAMYEAGRGVPADLSKARELYRRATSATPRLRPLSLVFKNDYPHVQQRGLAFVVSCL
jgi:hypothetical protein